jgi:hypothetical protein
VAKNDLIGQLTTSVLQTGISVFSPLVVKYIVHKHILFHICSAHKLQ